jgi:nitroimidazol reductase NimA-like FMN-containing flavoprotein (pyridoxamine 5'-phosphate oxidase superfamily)
MTLVRAVDALARGFAGRVATVVTDGWPYCVSFLYVWADGELLLHNSAVRGHFRANVDYYRRVCFEIDEPNRRTRCCSESGLSMSPSGPQRRFAAAQQHACN